MFNTLIREVTHSIRVYINTPLWDLRVHYYYAGAFQSVDCFCFTTLCAHDSTLWKAGFKNKIKIMLGFGFKKRGPFNGLYFWAQDLDMCLKIGFSYQKQCFLSEDHVYLTTLMMSNQYYFILFFHTLDLDPCKVLGSDFFALNHLDCSIWEFVWSWTIS